MAISALEKCRIKWNRMKNPYTLMLIIIGGGDDDKRKLYLSEMRLNFNTSAKRKKKARMS